MTLVDRTLDQTFDPAFDLPFDPVFDSAFDSAPDSPADWSLPPHPISSGTDTPTGSAGFRAGFRDGLRDGFRATPPDGDIPTDDIPTDGWTPRELAADAAALLGDLAAEEGNTPLAERYYRRVRDRWPGSAARSGAEISLAEILLADGSETALTEARTLLACYHDRPGPKPDAQLFRWHLANLHLADLTGEDDTARESAILALELAARGRDIPSHQAEGTVDVDRGTLRRLRERIGFRRRADPA